jgi:hypothetical protein
MSDFLATSDAVLRMLQRDMDRHTLDLTRNPLRSPFASSIFGMPVRESRAFPCTIDCAKCGGTGKGGAEATYCPKCAGAGATRVEGVMTSGDQTIMLTSPLPRKFAPNWEGRTVPKRPLSGFRTVAWP